MTPYEECAAFVNGLILSSTEGREPMTLDDARYNLMQWQAEGIEDIPADLHPALLAELWNYGIAETMSAPEFFDSIGNMNRYMLLDRMRSDCSYYIAHEMTCPPVYNHLWAHHNPAAQITYMKYLLDSFPADEKPEWISYQDIENFERIMITERSK